ncbi:sulfatase-like hydrolase/transferase [Pontiella sulfatireligans]|uniref:Arylsulfatase n=1 Tax=Pontiella sulfatireligans TaxID=2750658 RepID=A0A6C2UFU7_9BACT|nr:sulfatase-like hydrolase/transferase [Pontiella sulfatireligans]SPS74148.1 sulfatase S1_24 [Kiritimatiellales bacterium]VGO18301.1 Arylsulfatase [Pontiella sulfatireligans]
MVIVNVLKQGLLYSVFFVATSLLATSRVCASQPPVVSPPVLSIAEGSNPNIVLIMADDLGAESVGCYGSTVFSTPNLDRMARRGARFENAYGTPSCSPSRAMIMTGQYLNRTGFLERLKTGAGTGLPAHVKTFGHFFQQNGYETGIAGKWHLGDFEDFPDHPAANGFDTYYMYGGYIREESYGYGPPIWENGTFTVLDKSVYGPDLYCDSILTFIEENRDRPFLAYYPMTLVHKPFIAPPMIDDQIKHFFPESASADEKHYALMVSYMDRLVGRVLDKLDELGLAENTLVIFTADNGTPNAITSHIGDLAIKGGKLALIESGYRIPMIATWPGTIPVGTRDSFMTLTDVYPTLAGLTGHTVDHEVDGMDLSHTFLDQPGTDREYVYMAWEGDRYFVRDKRFRLHQDGRLYDIPVSSNETRYSEKHATNPEHADARKRLEGKLAEFKKIKKSDDSYTLAILKTNKKLNTAEEMGR